MAVLTRTVTDAVGLRDTRYGWGRRWGRGFGGPAALTVERVNQDPRAWVREATDSVALADTTRRGFVRAQVDAVGLTERTSLRVNSRLVVQATESVGLSDRSAAAAARARVAADAVALSDGASQVREFAREGSDVVTTGDALTRVGQVLLVDVMAMSDPAQIERLLLRSALDVAGVSERTALDAAGSRRVSDGAGLADTLVVRAVVLDSPGIATLADVRTATAALVSAQQGSAVLVASPVGQGAAWVMPGQAGSSAVTKDVSAGGTSTIYRTTRSS